MSWYIHPSKQLRDDELPPKLVVTNRDGSIEQVYVPYRTATIVKVSRQSHVALGHYECGECSTTINVSDHYCRRCGAKITKGDNL